MRRSLKWGLVASIALSAIALSTSQTPRIAAAIEPQIRQHMAFDIREGSASSGGPALAPLPAALPPLKLAAAERDMFGTSAPAQPEPAPVPTPPPEPVVEAAPPAPQAPAINLRFFGTMTTPEGKRHVYLTRGDKELAVTEGDQLEEGYVVSAVAPEGVTLTYPALSTTVVIPIPNAAVEN